MLAAIAARDTAALRKFRLTEREHNEVIWPELPASNPAANFPVDFAWRNIEVRNAGAVRWLIARYGGRSLEFLSVACRGGTVAFRSFRVLTDCWVRFRAGDSVEERQLFKDAAVWRGTYKIFRYYDEPGPRRRAGPAVTSPGPQPSPRVSAAPRGPRR